MKIRWTQSALTDVEAIEAYISRRSARYARGMVERIFDRVAQLDARPQLGAVVPEYADESIRELLAKPYRIIYGVFDDRIDILLIGPLHTWRYFLVKSCFALGFDSAVGGRVGGD